MRRMLASVLTSFFSHGFGISRAARRVSAVVLLLFMTRQAAHGFVVTTPGKNKPCVVTGLNFEGSTDLEALNE